MEEIRGKRIVWPEKGKVALEDFTIEELGPTEVLIRTKNTLISPGTESAFLAALPNTSGKFPQYPGYSNAGEIIAVGDKVEVMQIGDRVVSRSPHSSHVAVQEGELFRIPQNLPFDESTFFSLSSVALQGIRKAQIEIGDSVIVLGQGLVGQLALRIAKLSGAIPLIGVDLYDRRLHHASKGGAGYTLNSSKVNLEKEIWKITQGKGANVVIEATGNPEIVPLSFKLAARFGRVVLLASPRGESVVDFYSDVHYKGIRVIGARSPSTRPIYESFHGLWTRQDDIELVLTLLSKDLLKVRDLVSQKISFKDASTAYRKIIECREDVLGVVLDWTEK